MTRANVWTNPQANGRDTNLAGSSKRDATGMSQGGDNLAGSEPSLRTLAAALIELALQILGDESLEEDAA